MAVTPQLIKELRERSGAGMLDCKKALEANDGNIDKSIDWLREKGIAKAAKKSGRVAAEGLVFGSEKGNVGALVEFNSETDFVAKNDDFKSFGEKLVNLVIENRLHTVEELKAFSVDGKTVEEMLTELIAKIGENLNIRRVVLTETEGFVATYIHLGGKIGVLIELDGENTSENHEKARAAAMHMAAMDPKYLSKDQVTTTDLEKEREIEKHNLLQEGKPENIIERILDGKMNKFYEENCFLEQKFVKNDKVTVGQFLAPLTLKSCVRFKVGEGIEKVETDFAAEVAAQIAGAK